jgi:Flp pilus assembly protein TadD
MTAARIHSLALWLAVLSVAAFWPSFFGEPGALDRWVLPKILVLGVAALFAVFAVPRGRLPRGVVITLGIGVVVLVIAALAGETPLASVLGVWPRFEGLVTGGAYLLALWLGARLLGSGDRTAVELPIATLSLLVGALSLIEALGLRPIATNLARPGALLGNATDQGAVGAVCVVLLLLPVWRAGGRRRLILAAGLLAGLATVIASGSRAALLALLVGVIAVAITQGRRAYLPGGILVAATAAVALVAPSIGPRILGSSALAGATVSDRLLIWGETLGVVAQHPLVGVGPSGYADAVVAAHDTAWFATVGQDSLIDSPHNVLLQALVIGGPLLLAAAVVLAVFLVRSVLRQRGDFVVGAAVGVGVLTIVLLTHVSSPSTLILLLLLAGALVAVPTVQRWRIATTAVIAVWLALVAVTLAGEVALGRAVEATDLDTAADSFDTAAALRPWDTGTPRIAAETFTAHADAGAERAAPLALEWSRRALAASPTSVPAAQALITSALASGELELAASTAEDFVELRPNHPWLQARLGGIRILQGDLDAAEAPLVRATELDPTWADPWLTLAFLYEQRGDLAAADDAQARAAALSR